MISLAVYKEEKCFLFALGRNAMYAGCLALGLKEQDEVLTPAFDCDGALQPFRVLGLKLVFFKSDPHNFCADIEDIKKKVTSRTRLLHIVNYFGLPQPWEELLRLKETLGLPVLEDNAYSLFSRINGQEMGTFGDIAIFSLRKTLPLIDGGMLRINNPEFSCAIPEKKARFCYPTEYLDLLRLIGRRITNNRPLGILRVLQKAISPMSVPPVPLYQDPKKGFPDWPFRDYIDTKFSCDYLRPISGLAKRQLSAYSRDDFDFIAAKQREYYLRLSENLGCIKGLKVLWASLPEGIVPFCLSVLIPGKRDLFFTCLKRKYNVMAWPTLSKELLKELEAFPEVGLLGRNLLQINLLPERVINTDFSDYLEALTDSIRALALKEL